MHEWVVLIGRFQPPHLPHLELVRFAFKQGEKLIIVLGSDNKARDTMNPFTSAQRAEMIRSCLTADENKRVEFIYAKDFESNNMWLAAVQRAIDDVTGGSSDVKLVGHKKDASSFYLKMFPQWGDYIESGLNSDISATKVRSNLFRKDKITIKPMLPPAVYDYVCNWMDTAEYERLHDEYHEILDAEAKQVGSEHPIISVCTDAIVMCSGHVLVVKRGGKYGRGLIAWPGGYIRVDQALFDSCLRELKEETGLALSKEELKKYLVDKDVFDEPRRDLRGRVITHAYCFNLPDGPLPWVKGMDDADKAWWMTINDFHVNEPKFFADHYRIGCRFVNRSYEKK